MLQESLETLLMIAVMLVGWGLLDKEAGCSGLNFKKNNTKTFDTEALTPAWSKNKNYSKN